MVHICNKILLSHEKNEIIPFVTPWMNVEISILSEVSQKEKDKYHMISHMWNLSYNTNELINETDSKTQRTRLVAREKGYGGGIDWKFGISRCKLVCVRWINNKVLMHSTGNYTQYPVTDCNGKEYEKECLNMYMHN